MVRKKPTSFCLRFFEQTHFQDVAATVTLFIPFYVLLTEAEVPVIQRTKGDFESSDMKPVVVDVGRHVTSLSRVNINVKCTARGLPPPRIEWMNGGKMLDVKGPMLSLKNVSVADSGIYTCIASNVAGRANASTFVNITGVFFGCLECFLFFLKIDL